VSITLAEDEQQAAIAPDVIAQWQLARGAGLGRRKSFVGNFREPRPRASRQLADYIILDQPCRGNPWKIRDPAAILPSGARRIRE
jgi:hypothetical protein